MNQIYQSFLSNEFGTLQICGNQNSITAVKFVDTEVAVTAFENEITIQCKQELQEYFDGKRQVFSVPLQLQGTPFQNRVWETLTSINYGETITYLALAKRLGNVKSIRAAASANSKNPISIIVPCHRVIGSGGKLVGYAGGLWRKQKLLALEQETSGTYPAIFN